MPYDKNISPVGWYVVSYLIRFVELEDEGRDDDEARFLSWENTILVQAESLDEAFEKGTLFGKETTQPYRGGPDGVMVQWDFVGITDITPVYEEFKDGSEIAWTERSPRKLRNLRQMVGASSTSFKQ